MQSTDANIVIGCKFEVGPTLKVITQLINQIVRPRRTGIIWCTGICGQHIFFFYTQQCPIRLKEFLFSKERAVIL